MMANLRKKKWFILLMGLAGLVALDFVAASLVNLRFEPARPFSFEWQPGGPVAESPSLETDTSILEFIIYSYLFIVFISLIISLFRPELRKMLFKKLAQLAVFALAAYLLMSVQFPMDEGEVVSTIEPAPQTSAGNLPGINDAFAPPQVNSWVQFAISFGITLGLVFALGWLALRLTAKKPQGGFILDEIATIARKTLREFESGQNWDEVIINCYIRMSEVASEQRGIYRQAAMTPLEFATKMEKAGLPAEAVRTLTNLFDEVRYGGRKADVQQRDLAVAALNAILMACGVRA